MLKTASTKPMYSRNLIHQLAIGCMKIWGCQLSVSIILTNAILVHLPLIYKYDTDLAKYLPDLYIAMGQI